MKESIIKWIFRVSISIVVLLLSLQVVTTKPYMNFSKDKYTTHHLVTWDHTFATDNIIDYLNGKIETLDFPSFPGGDDVLMSERGLLHMEDVEVLFRQGRILISFLIVVASVTGIYLYDRKKLIETLKQIWIAPAVFSALLGVAILVDFRTTFTTFHKIFFSNDLWLLSWDDPLIILVPPSFFMNTAAIILGLFVLVHGLIVLFAYKTSIRL